MIKDSNIQDNGDFLFQTNFTLTPTQKQWGGEDFFVWAHHGGQFFPFSLSHRLWLLWFLCFTLIPLSREAQLSHPIRCVIAQRGIRKQRIQHKKKHTQFIARALSLPFSGAPYMFRGCLLPWARSVTPWVDSTWLRRRLQRFAFACAENTENWIEKLVSHFILITFKMAFFVVVVAFFALLLLGDWRWGDSSIL